MGKEISKLFLLLLLLLLLISGSAAILSFVNECSYTVWPATFSGNGPTLGDGGFSLAPGQLVQLIADPGWSGRVWARTGCNFDSSGNGKCLTGECGSLNCIGDGQPPFTLAQFIIALGTTDNNFYDVSLVEGYNVGIRINATGGTSDCQYAGCIANLNCPPELQVVDVSGSVVACKSACEAFNAAQFCCADDYSTPQTCSRTQYSEMFKKACPNAYSYPYDDVSSRFTCSGSNFLITFCPKGL
ncbi:pathogenesis-related protein 5-like isoform X2 [Juglans microcarpa x Juglans regia]|uniref:pathogenesis-related protein 5-like isoform X2 n=1 Tax=Juglans microcarpa x Juglans regia TaxID=2249226 RepID=UPI001B7E0318|nr:pathogenesis-related protein 5-like isoform X2 [Juglans microcarpa x Juglans regia]